jgi:hypothetical protein
MELEFDKEIDSLLRKNGEGARGVLVGDAPGGSQRVHLDADQLSAFAENAIPEKSRGLYMSHLADCDHCRRILSGLIALNAEAEPVKEPVVAPAIVPATSIEPWYRRLLLPNLAYVMGGLVLIFGGLITFSLLQSSNGSETISQSVANTSSARGPMDVAQELESSAMPSNANASAASNQPLMNANASSNAVAANAAPSGSSSAPLKEKDAAPADDRLAGVTLDGVDAAKPAAAAPAPMPPPPAQTQPSEAVISTEEAKREEAKARSITVKKKDAQGEREDAALAAKQGQDVARTQAGGVSKPTPGPSRDGAQNFPNRANTTYEMYEEKRVSGKTFRNRDGVWYDLVYRGQATNSVRRRSDEYRKLDSGLRTIAESLGGTVVVVWESKAYRIQ